MPFHNSKDAALSTTSFIAVGKVDDALEKSFLYIDRQSEYITINGSDDRVKNAIRWLIDRQSPSDGSWSASGTAPTTLAVLALYELKDLITDEALSSGISTSIQNALKFLTASYQNDAFEKAPWDVAMVLRVLTRQARRQQDLIDNISSWLISEMKKPKNIGPHHYAQVVIALQESGSRREHIEEIQNILLANIRDRYNEYSPYVLSQCLEALQQNEHISLANEIKASLRKFLKDSHVDSANFVNICSGLAALQRFGNLDEFVETRTNLSTLFGNTCFRDNGTWYHDVLLTSWALITLAKSSKEVVVRVPKVEIKYETAIIFNELREEIDRELNVISRREIMNHVVLTLASLIFIFASATLIYVNYFTSIGMGETAFWIATVSIGGLGAYIGKGYSTIFRRFKSMS